MTPLPAESPVELDTTRVLRVLADLGEAPTWDQLRYAANLSARRLQAALSRLIFRTKQVEVVRDAEHGWPRYTMTTTDFKQLVADIHADNVVQVIRSIGGPAEADYICEQASERFAMLHNETKAAIKAAVSAGKIASVEFVNGQTFYYDLELILANPKPAFPPHIDTVIAAIRASGGIADREAIWGRSPGLTWDEVDRAIQAARKAKRIEGDGVQNIYGGYRVIWRIPGENPPIRVQDYGVVADPPPLTTDQRRALLNALLRGHHDITDEIIAAGESWWTTADPLLREMVERGQVNLQWQPRTRTMHYFERKEAA